MLFVGVITCKFTVSNVFSDVLTGTPQLPMHLQGECEEKERAGSMVCDSMRLAHYTLART